MGSRRRPAIHEEDEVGPEPDPVGKGAGDESRSDDGEHHLVGDVGVKRDAGREDIPGREVHEKRVVEVADHPAHVTAETERVAEEVPDDGGDAHGDVALDHDGEHVLAPY